eukprot:CAMPEP_0206029474 /NCGR_PEP_ID=MMETSP1464-20131121/46737_1 /ASSEMBLY_ACC=CAM_ASM_001124 /TAXON_ID=119497 /ORGANISM="Exanthemachrysis gayraliae, Strain RCC1523" /LENGTH=83 /DNA_ID=CAMNT_0053403559 /DNA_START=190 /DNA_END=438 /DNA_ORIENTATION=+
MRKETSVVQLGTVPASAPSGVGRQSSQRAAEPITYQWHGESQLAIQPSTQLTAHMAMRHPKMSITDRSMSRSTWDRLLGVATE